MTSELALKFAIANVAVAILVGLVLLARKPARSLFGARLAYRLWLLTPLPLLVLLLPSRIQTMTLPAPTFDDLPPMLVDLPTMADVQQPAAAATIDPVQAGLAVWLVGLIAMALWQMRSQARFLSDARAGLAGPAVVSVVRPRIVTPSDFEDRFEPSEREVILAHEAIHLDRNDARINALVALLRCICWFNPMVHVAAHMLRIDQELACDAAVVERHPRAKALYASALLKAQLAARPLPLGCYWPAGTEHPLMERIEMLKHASPGRLRRLAGTTSLLVLVAGAGFSAWAALPPELKIVEEEPAPAPVIDPQAVAVPAVPTRAATTAPAAAISSPTAAPDTDFSKPPAPAGYDGSDRLFIRGKVERLEFGPTTYTTYLRATAIADGYSPTGAFKANSDLWRLSPTPYSGSKDSIAANLLKRDVAVYGLNAAGKSCKPTCSLYAVRFMVPKDTAVRLPASGGMGVTQFANMYDTRQPFGVTGKVERIEFADGVFDVYLRPDALGDQGVTYQVRSVSRYPREEIEAQFTTGQSVTATGFPARKMGFDDGVCGPVCGMYATGFFISGDRITPDGPELVTKRRVAPTRYEEPQNQQAPLGPLPLSGDQAAREISALELKAADADRRVAELQKRFGPNHPELRKALADQEEIQRQLKAAKPQPARYEPQQAAPAAPAPGWKPFAATYDANEPLLLEGVIEGVDPNDGVGMLTVRSTKETPLKSGSRPAHTIWRAETRLDAMPDAARAGLLGKTVVIRGYNAKDKSCATTCLMNARDITFPDGSKVQMSPPGPSAPQPAPSSSWPAPQSGSGPMAVEEEPYEPAPQAPRRMPDPGAYDRTGYDTSDGHKLTGVIEAVEQIDGETIVWMTAKTALKDGFGVRPGTEAPTGRGMLWRVEGPGLGKLVVKDLPKLVEGARITVTGYNADDKSCKPTCRIQARKVSLK